MSKLTKALEKLASKKELELKVDSGVLFIELDNEIDIAVDHKTVEIRYMQISIYDGTIDKDYDAYKLFKKVYKFSRLPTSKKYAKMLQSLVEATNHTRMEPYRLELSDLSPVALLLTNNENYRIKAYPFKTLKNDFVNIRELNTDVEVNI